MKLFQKLFKQYSKFCRLKTEIAARSYLRKNQDLNDLILEINSRSESIGLSSFEYVRLYQLVRDLKPEYVLECGTGRSTFVIAHAMSKNENGKKLVTMEQSEKWAGMQREALSYFFNHEKANEWFPGEPSDLVELIYSDVTIERHRIWAGSCYKNIKDYPYTFMMVDGPVLTNDCFLNLDLVNIIKKSVNPVFVWLDGRWPTATMCRALFGDKFISKPGWTHTEISGATQEDVLKDKKSITKEMRKMAKGI